MPRVKRVNENEEVAKKVTKTASNKKTTNKEKAVKSEMKGKTTAKNKTTKTAKTKETTTEETKTVNTMLSEYYDLPYGYNQTTVKILAQTPTTLFVYWDISDEDRNNLVKQYGKNFFYETKPILIVHNTTRSYSFEIEINDFANSWYIRCQEPNCDYIVELGRKKIENNNEYIFIDSSNDIISPNDHILFEKANLGSVLFKNVKTGVVSSKDFGSLRFINDIDKLYGNIYDVYSRLYQNEDLNEMMNPSSGEFIMRS